MASPNISILPTAVERDVTVGNISNKEEKALDSFFQELSEGAYFDTGILPVDGTGTLAIRKAFNHTQIVFQHKPDAYLVTWGTYEHDANAKTYKVAQPYRVVIGDLIDGNLLGARHFYSPVPVQTGDQILYHVNLPNLNCKGYGGNSVGWMCLYHKTNWKNDPFNTKVHKLLERASGAEAYNDDNMSETDGPRFYAEKYNNAKDKSYLWIPSQWEAKTQKEGVNWTLDPNLWIPIKVAGMDSQQAHADSGVPLTLEMAMIGGYHAYYTDPHQPKPVNAYARSDLKNPTGKVIFDFINKAFVQSKKKEEDAPQVPAGLTVKKPLKKGQGATAQAPPAASPVYTAAAPVNPVVGSCYYCHATFHQDDTFHNLFGYKVCDTCKAEYYGECAECHKLNYYSYMAVHEDKSYCSNCHSVNACDNCGKTYLDDTSAFISGINGTHCLSCSTYEYCHSCNNKFIPAEVHTLEAKVPVIEDQLLTTTTQTIILCNDCMSKSVTCGCGLIKNEADVGHLGDGTFACEPCIGFKDDGLPCFVGQFVNIN